MQTKPHRFRKLFYGLCVVLLISGYTYWSLNRPLPLLKPVSINANLQTKPVASNLAWPASGQAAVSIADSDIIESHGSQTPAPIASVAKVITVLTVLNAKPLASGQQGPIITLTDNDVALFRSYAAQDGSLVPVVAGEQISQYQMLQAIMLPSANNIADSLAIWAFGSLPAYAQAANAYLAKNGLTNTHVGTDASGLSPTTTSTATDLVKLGKLAMAQPVLSQVASQSTATGIPQTTIVRNYNSLLGTANIIGVKTGNSDQAGGVFLSASKITVNQKPITIITSVVGTPDLGSALRSSASLIESAQANFQTVTVIKAGTKVGTYQIPWAGKVDATVSKDLTLTNWKKRSIKATAQLNPVAAHQNSAGTVYISKSALNKKQLVPVEIKQTVPEPSPWWRLTHPLN